MRRHVTYANVISNGTLGAADVKRGLLSAPVQGNGASGAPGPQGPAGPQGEPGAKGDAGPGAVPISISMDEGDFQVQYVDLGSWTVGFTCTARGAPQVQLWGYTDEGAAGTLQWVGIRTHSAEGSFITNSGTQWPASANRSDKSRVRGYAATRQATGLAGVSQQGGRGDETPAVGVAARPFDQLPRLQTSFLAERVTRGVVRSAGLAMGDGEGFEPGPDASSTLRASDAVPRVVVAPSSV